MRDEPATGEITGLSATGGYIPTLDGWRAVSIFGVLLAHVVERPWAGKGALGVNVFFGISGLLICSRLLVEQRATGRIHLGRFYTRRATRILPPYMTYLAFIVLLTALGRLAASRWEWLSCLLFFRNYLPVTAANWYTSHFWSLAVEEHFYLVWPVLLVMLGPRRALGWSLGLSVAVAAWRLGDQAFHVTERWFGIEFTSKRTDVCLDGLFMGCWMALVLERPYWRAWLHRRLTPRVWLVAVGAFFANMVIPLPLSHFRYSVLIPFLLVGTILHSEAWPARLLETRPMRWLGRLSYSLYIWHLVFLASPYQSWSPALGGYSSPVLGLLAAFVAASLSYYLIERPMIRFGHHLTRRPSAVAAEAARA